MHWSELPDHFTRLIWGRLGSRLELVVFKYFTYEGIDILLARDFIHSWLCYYMLDDWLLYIVGHVVFKFKELFADFFLPRICFMIAFAMINVKILWKTALKRAIF